jgi:hypothetical protein
MSNNHGAATADDPMDMTEHEATFASFVALTETAVAILACVLLALVLWGLEGHGFVALVGVILSLVGAAVGALTGQGWRVVAPVFVLLGLACIVL